MLKTRRLNRTGFAGGRVACVLRGHFDVLSPTQATYSSSRPSLSTSGRASDMHQLKRGLDRFCFLSEFGECRARAVIRKIGYHHSRNLVAAANAAWQAGRTFVTKHGPDCQPTGRVPPCFPWQRGATLRPPRPVVRQSAGFQIRAIASSSSWSAARPKVKLILRGPSSGAARVPLT